MRLFTLLPRFPKNADLTAAANVRPLMRCAAHSERISVVGTPHTFSVYDLKKSSNRRRPKRLTTHVSKESSVDLGVSAALMYDARHRMSSTGPSFRITSVPRSG